MTKKLHIKKNNHSITLIDEEDIQDKLDEKADATDLESLSEQIDDIVAGDLDLTTYAKKTDLRTDEITDENTYSNISNAEQTQESINAAIDDKLGALSDIDLVKVVGTKPTASADTMNKLYLVAESSSITEDNYEIFITVRSGSANNYSYTWEKVDTARVNLSNYIQKSSTVGLVKNDGSIDTATKLNVSQGSTNAGKNVVTDANGDITTEAKPTIPTKTSDLTNDSNFVTTSDSRLTDTRNPRMIHIGASSSTTKDLDNYTTAGFYYCNNDVNEARYITNQPLTSNQVSFFLLVETWNATNYIKQTLTYYLTGDTYIRTKRNTAGWNVWQKITFDGHTHKVIDLTNYMPKSNSSQGTAGYVKILNIKTSQTYLDDPITFDIYQRNTKKPIHCSLKFAGENNSDPNVAFFNISEQNNDVYIYKASQYNWQILVKKLDNYDSITVENINCNWGRWHLWANDISLIFTHLDETITALPSDTTNNPLVKATYNISDVLTDTDTDRSLSANQGKVLKGLIDGKITNGTGTVTSTNIADGTIVNGDIANTTITGGKLVNGTVTATQLASNAVETAKIADSAVTSAKIADKTIVNGDISDSAAIAYSKLSGVAASTHSHSYLPLSGGTMSGPIKYPQLRSSGAEDNMPYAGQFAWNTNILTTLKERKSLLGTATDGSNWWSVISVRHRNGYNDGNLWGMHIRAPLTTNTAEADANLYWQRDLNGNTTNERILIDNENMVKNSVVNNVLSRATNNQSATGWFKILTIKIQGGYSDSTIKFSINTRSEPTTNIELYFQYYKKDSESSDFYYKLNKCYYDGQPHDTWVKQTVDNVGTGTFDVYIYAAAWADTSITPIITNNNRLNKNNLIITPANTFVTSLPSGCIQAVKNPNYVADNDSRLSNARTPTSHTDSNGAYGKATTSVWGHTKLNSATNSTDETTAATPKAVKAAYDLANGKITNGTGTVTSTNIADKTIVNGDIADNAAIAYSKLSGVAASSHTHGYLTNDGKLGGEAGKPVMTCTDGKICAGSFGTAANTVCQGNDSRLSNTRTPTFNHIDASSSVAKDLNNYKTGGFYYTQSNANDVPYVANRPDSRNFAFFLLVETWGASNDKYVKQTLTYYDNNVTYVRTCNNGTWNPWRALIKESDSRLSDARTPTSHASTGTGYGASSASNYGHAMASSTTPIANGTAAVGSETTKFARGDHVHPIPSVGTVQTLTLANSSAMSGTVKWVEKNGWATVFWENFKCTTTTTGFTPVANLPSGKGAPATIYGYLNTSLTGTNGNGIHFRVGSTTLDCRVYSTSAAMYGHITYPLK